MNFFKKKSEHDVFYRFTLSYILLIIFLLIFFLYSYSYSYNMLKNQIQSSNLVNLRYSIGIMDQQIKQLDNSITLISEDVSINAAMDIKIPISDPEYLEYRASIENLNRYMQNQSFYEKSDAYLYIKNSDKILLTLTMHSLESYYSQVLKYPDSFFDMWKEIISYEYIEGTVIPESSPIYLYDATRIFYARSIPYTYFKPIAGTVIVPISREVIRNTFSGLNAQNTASVYILDKNGDKVMNIFDSFDIFTESNDIGFSDIEGYIDVTGKNGKYFVTYATSEMNGWKYICVVPESDVYEMLYRYRNFSVTFLFAAVGMGIIISVFLAYRNSKPIMNIDSQLKSFLMPSDKKNGSFSEISGGINTLIEQNMSLSTDIKNNAPLLKDNFINNIFKGRLKDKDEFNTFSNYLNLDINFEKYGVIVVGVSSFSETENGADSNLNMWKEDVKSSLSYFFGSDAIVHDLDYKTIGILKNFTDSDFAAYCHDKTEAINVDLNKRLGIKIIASAANPCSDPLEIWHAYDQAERALGYASGSAPFVWYDNIFVESDIYYFPLDFEKRLIDLVKDGNKKQVDKLFELLYDENFRIRKLSHKMKKELFMELKGTLNKIQSDNIEQKIEPPQISDKEDIDAIREDFALLCDMFLSLNGEPKKNIINDAMMYIDENYADPDLGLSKISTVFGLSEGYFSVMFKMHTGTNFTEYVEKVRVTHAEELIKNTEESIDVIAQMVGYNSSQTFRRAFKKVYGIIPTSLRK